MTSYSENKSRVLVLNKHIVKSQPFGESTSKCKMVR